ncbi:MAG TPA: pilus assembly protein TadG-related protein [Tepidisphaeraceae bacterium]|nr:pilus assembly protein TadG-related protein [Tepidisphaeraceae bacterium]
MSKERLNNRMTGGLMIYMIIVLTVLLLFASLAVDLGRAQLAKTELRRAADAAARYGASGFANNSVVNNAIAAAADNNVDGTSLVLQSSDVTIGVWNNGAFKTSGAGTSAVRVRAYRTSARNTGIPLLFAGIFRSRTIDITAQSIATYVPATNVTINAQSKGDPWLAGMPNGTTANSYDSAPNNSPTQVSGLTITPGGKLHFDFDGSVSYLPGKGSFGPDGNLGRMIYNGWYTGFNTGQEHGMSNLTAPITSVVGVFLDDTQPDKAGALPADLDFSSDSSRDFSTLSPQVRQPFFIGDGLRNDGTTPQDFIVPAGATRLFIGVMDGQQWSDNSGSFATNISMPPTITMVQ